jgi:hypothetical protein
MTLLRAVCQNAAGSSYLMLEKVGVEVPVEAILKQDIALEPGDGVSKLDLQPREKTRAGL